MRESMRTKHAAKEPQSALLKPINERTRWLSESVKIDREHEWSGRPSNVSRRTSVPMESGCQTNNNSSFGCDAFVKIWYLIQDNSKWRIGLYQGIIFALVQNNVQKTEKTEEVMNSPALKVICWATVFFLLTSLNTNIMNNHNLVDDFDLTMRWSRT